MMQWWRAVLYFGLFLIWEPDWLGAKPATYVVETAPLQNILGRMNQRLEHPLGVGHIGYEFHYGRYADHMARGAGVGFRWFIAPKQVEGFFLGAGVGVEQQMVEWQKPAGYSSQTSAWRSHVDRWQTRHTQLCLQGRLGYRHQLWDKISLVWRYQLPFILMQHNEVQSQEVVSFGFKPESQTPPERQDNLVVYLGYSL